MTRFTGTKYETEFKKKLQEQGFHVLNLGQNEAGDLIAFKDGKVIIFEVKSVKGDEFRFNPKTRLQWEKLKEDSKYADVYYAVKFLKRGWKVFKLPDRPEPLRIGEKQ